MEWGYTLKKAVLIFIALLMATALYAQTGTAMGFHNFPYGTSMETFRARMGNPVHSDEVNGLQSLVYDNVQFQGYSVFMIAFFSGNGLEGGTYYFYTRNLEDMTACYTALQREMIRLYGPTLVYEPETSGKVVMREARIYESTWSLPAGYIYLKANRRSDEPISLWFSSPSLTRRLNGN